MKAIREKHAVLMRWTHWVNFPVLAIMIWSGLLIYWANDVYTVTIFGHTFVRFFPNWLYKLLHIPFRLAEGMAFHFLFMWFFAVNGLLYLLYTVCSGAWRGLLPQKKSFHEAWLVLLHDLHIRRTAPPQDKYNAAQRIAYTAIIVMGMGSLATGLAIYKPVQFYWLCWLCGGYHFARIFHFALTIGYVLFFVIHIVQVILAGWNNFRAVVAGFEVEEEAEATVQAPAETVQAPAETVQAPSEAVPPSEAEPVPAQALEAAVVAEAEAAMAAEPESMVLLPSAVKPPAPVPRPPLTVDQKIHRRNFISFTTFAVLGSVAFGGWKWLYNSMEEIPGVTAGARLPLRRALNKTELFFRRFFDDSHHVRTYPKSMAAKNVRVNANIGMRDPAFKVESWMLSVGGPKGDVLQINIDQIKSLPKTELIYDFKCVEGWDQIQHWAGVRFVDFVRHFQLDEVAKMAYVGMETPDGGYYVGLDRESALHPQTLLAYELNDQPIPLAHGAPLRLIIPVKYGIKNLKRIGKITFSNQRPRDYWAEQGYDYYSGL